MNHSGQLLLITQTVPSDIAKASHGIFQRMRMLLDAAAAAFSSVKVAFLATEQYCRKNTAASLQAEIREHWKIDIDVLLIQKQDFKENWLRTYIAPILGPRHDPQFSIRLSRESLHALQAGISENTRIIIAHRLHVGLLLRDLKVKNIPQILDLDDIEHVKFSRELRRPPFWTSKHLMHLHLPALRHFEIKTVRSTTKTLVCSTADQRYLQNLCRTVNVEAIPNGVSTVGTPCSRPVKRQDDGATVVFVGSYTYAPNIEAAEILINDIFPIISKEIPNARLRLIGNKIEYLPSFKTVNSNIDFLGFVPDLGPIYETASIACCPIQSGGGTRIKIIEAASFGIPVVTTTVGAEGLEFAQGEEIRISNNAADIAQICIELLKDAQLRKNIGNAALKKAKKYERNNSIRLVKEMLAAETRASLETSRLHRL